MIFCGTKGMAYVELRAKGASHDLHSMYGGLAPNPAWRLVQALRTIKDENGEITLDGLNELIEASLEERPGSDREDPVRRSRPQSLPGASIPSTVTLPAKKR